MNLCSIFTSAFQTLSTLSRQSSMNKYYRLARATSLSHIWLNLGLSIGLRRYFYPAQIILHICTSNWMYSLHLLGHSVHFRMNMCVCDAFWVLVCLFSVCLCILYVSVSSESVTWRLECKILMCKNISTQPQGFKCRGLCKWNGICFLYIVHL